MQPSPMIRANLLAPILDALSVQGHDTDPLLRSHALPFAHPIDPYQLVPLAGYVALFEHAAAILGEPFLGLRLGQVFKPELLGPLGFMFQASADLRAALQRLSSYVSVWQSGTHVELVPGEITADYIYQIDDPALRPRRQDAEYSMASICSLIRNLLGDKWAPLEIHFEHQYPGTDHRASRAYAQAFHAPVFFAQNLNRLVIRQSDLCRASVSSDRSMLPFMERHLHDLARESREPESFSCQVKHLIARRIGYGPIGLPAIAAELGLPAPFLSAPSRRGTHQLSPSRPRAAPFHRRIADKEPHHNRHLSGPHVRLCGDSSAFESLQELDRHLTKNLRQINQRNLAGPKPLDGCPMFAYMGRKKRANPDFLHGTPNGFACAAFIKESRMKFANADKLDWKSGEALRKNSSIG